MDKDNNIFNLVPKTEEPTPADDHDYIVVTTDGQVHKSRGFLIFTREHVAIMRDYGQGAIPALVVPLNTVISAKIVDVDGNEVTSA